MKRAVLIVPLLLLLLFAGCKENEEESFVEFYLEWWHAEVEYEDQVLAKHGWTHDSLEVWLDDLARDTHRAERVVEMVRVRDDEAADFLSVVLGLTSWWDGLEGYTDEDWEWEGYSEEDWAAWDHYWSVWVYDPATALELNDASFAAFWVDYWETGTLAEELEVYKVYGWSEDMLDSHYNELLDDEVRARSVIEMIRERNPEAAESMEYYLIEYDWEADWELDYYLD